MAQTDGRRGGLPLPHPSTVITHLDVLRHLTFRDHRRSQPPSPRSVFHGEEELVAGRSFRMHPPAPVPQGHEPFGPGHERVGVGVGVGGSTQGEGVAVRDYESRTKTSWKT